VPYCLARSPNILHFFFHINIYTKSPLAAQHSLSLLTALDRATYTPEAMLIPDRRSNESNRPRRSSRTSSRFSQPNSCPDDVFVTRRSPTLSTVRATSTPQFRRPIPIKRPYTIIIRTAYAHILYYVKIYDFRTRTKIYHIYASDATTSTTESVCSFNPNT